MATVDAQGRYLRWMRSGQITMVRRALRVYASLHLELKQRSKDPKDKQHHQTIIDAADDLSTYLLKGE